MRFLAFCVLGTMTSLAFGSPLPDEPCVPEGGSSDTCADRPDLVGAGMPVGAVWANETGNPSAFENDPFSPNDPMGSASSADGGESACAAVSTTTAAIYEAPMDSSRTTEVEKASASKSPSAGPITTQSRLPSVTAARMGSRLAWP
jgi:hypothetical protein